MEFKIAEIKDIEQLCILLEELFSQEIEFKPQKQLQEKALKEIIESKDKGDIIVALYEGKIVGMLNLLYTISTALGTKVAILEDMIIKKEYQNKGIGSKLMFFAKTYAKNIGCKRVTLLTDFDNTKAHNFYEKNGFTKSSMIAFRLSL